MTRTSGPTGEGTAGMVRGRAEGGGPGSEALSASVQPTRATLRDVGERARVDPSIVSRVLAGEDWRASTSTRNRIDDAVKALNYVPHRMARALRTGETSTLAMLVPHIGDPAYFNMMAGAKAAAAAANYVVLFADTNDDEDLEAEEVDRLSGRVDGVVSATAQRGSKSLSRLRASGMPVVLLNRRADGAFASVIGQDKYGASLAVSHLAHLGHSRIAHLSGPLTLDPSERRRVGYLEAMKGAGLAVDSRWLVQSALNEEAAAGAAASLLRIPKRRRPTALFASTLPSALGALRELRLRGVDVPGELSVVGFDDHPLADHLWAPLSTVSMPHIAMGRIAVDRLISLIQGKAIPTETVVTDLPVLAVRGSTAPPRQPSTSRRVRPAEPEKRSAASVGCDDAMAPTTRQRVG
jgi:DNA-binding LacI/PurR family transcriptional regulator